MTKGSVSQLTAEVTHYDRPMLREGGLIFPVSILDARLRWGNVDFLVKPIGGTGEKWVSEMRVYDYDGEMLTKREV